MSRKSLRAAGVTIAMLLGIAMPALGHELFVFITADCECKYFLYADGSTDPYASVGIDFTFTVTSNGVDYPVSKHVDTNADGSGYFSIRVGGFPLPTSCGAPVSFTPGTATLTFNGQVETGFEVHVPDTLDCHEEPPPGKTFDIGPSSMEGHLLIRPGDWISGGYSFKFVSNTHPASTVTVSSNMTIPYKCPDGTTGQFVVNLGTHSHSVPAKNTDWQPTGDANSVLSWSGSAQAPAACGAGQVMDNSKGAIFEATVSQDPDNASLLNWRFKYRDPNAKGKGNVNCLDTSDPRRDKADVCGASWSATVRDP